MYEELSNEMGAEAAAAFSKIAGALFDSAKPHLTAAAIAGAVNVGIQMQYKPKGERDLARAARNGAMLGMGASIAMSALSKKAAAPPAVMSLLKEHGGDLIAGLSGAALAAGTIGVLGRRRRKDNTSYLEREADSARNAYEAADEILKRKGKDESFGHGVNDLRTSFMKRQAKLIADHPGKSFLAAAAPAAAASTGIYRTGKAAWKTVAPYILRKVSR